MDLKEAVDKARLILDEEEKRPTLNYRYVAKSWPTVLIFEETSLRSQGYTLSMAGVMALQRMRGKPRPREVIEDPNEWELQSTNYDLLMAIFGQLVPANRAMFLTGLINMTAPKYIPRDPVKRGFPKWDGVTSALPLLAEFCIRNGFLGVLIAALEKVSLPTPSIAGMVIQLEEAISLNFNVFSDAELEAMPIALKTVYDNAERQTWSSRGRAGGPQETNPLYRQGFSREGTEIVAGLDAFLTQCEQARYWYLKGALQQSRNLEVEGDKAAVEDYLTMLGFSTLMVQSLNAAEQDFRSTATSFELKNCLGHLRSFLEELHVQACPPLAQPTDILPARWGPATVFLRQHDVLTLKEEAFITTLYTLVSDEAIHPLIADREYARLFRNMVIEYGLLFLTTLQKKNVKIKATKP
jgi:hypothetical protein